MNLEARSGLNPQNLPWHVAVIMDGNGRWAAQHGKPRHAGHRAGVKAARAIVKACAEAKIPTLTLFAFSSENWRRPVDEVNGLMRLFVEVLQRELDELHANGIQFRFIGDRTHLPEILRKRIADAEAKTAGNHTYDPGPGCRLRRALGHCRGGARCHARLWRRPSRLN